MNNDRVECEGGSQAGPVVIFSTQLNEAWLPQCIVVGHFRGSKGRGEGGQFPNGYEWVFQWVTANGVQTRACRRKRRHTAHPRSYPVFSSSRPVNSNGRIIQNHFTTAIEQHNGQPIWPQSIPRSRRPLFIHRRPSFAVIVAPFPRCTLVWIIKMTTNKNKKQHGIVDGT